MPQFFNKKIYAYLIAIVFFFSVNHYNGIVADAILYTLQAINYLAPERFLSDPSFMFGNQDSFSLFSPIYVFFIKFFGLPIGAKVLCIFEHLVIAVSVIFLVDVWTNRLHCNCVFLPMTLLFFSLYAYGETRNEMWFSLKMIESYTVARNLSAGLATVGFAFVFKNLKWLSLFFVLGGTLVHPLTAGWFLPLWIFLYYPRMIKPIVVMSLLFPFTLFLNIGPFTKIPVEWMSLKDVRFDVIQFSIRMMGFVLFFALTCFRFTKRQSLKKIAFSLFIVSGIATYWFMVAGFGEHLFLFQAQTFRVEWLCVLSAFVMQVTMCFDVYLKIRKKEKLQLWDKILLAVVIVFWLDSIYVDILAFIVLLVIGKLSCRKIILGCSMVLFLVSIVVALCITFFLMRQRYPLFYMNYIYDVQYMLLIVGALGIVLVYLYSKFRIPIILCYVFALCMSRLCENPFTNDSTSFAYILMSIVLIVHYGGWTRGEQRVLGTVMIVGMIGISAYGYDLRDAGKKMAENSMDFYVENPPFEKQLDWGKVLIHVSVGGYVSMPRIFFLTGSYFDDVQEVGEIFFEKRKRTLFHREELLYYGTSDSSLYTRNISRTERKSEIRQKLNDRDTLLSRTEFLCKEQEITHLVTDEHLETIVKEDSLYLSLYNTPVYLYSCLKFNK